MQLMKKINKLIGGLVLKAKFHFPVCLEEGESRRDKRNDGLKFE